MNSMNINHLHDHEIIERLTIPWHVSQQSAETSSATL